MEMEKMKKMKTLTAIELAELGWEYGAWDVNYQEWVAVSCLPEDADTWLSLGLEVYDLDTGKRVTPIEDKH